MERVTTHQGHLMKVTVTHQYVEGKDLQPNFKEDLVR